jgi:hypothetical protein
LADIINRSLATWGEEPFSLARIPTLEYPERIVLSVTFMEAVRHERAAGRLSRVTI